MKKGIILAISGLLALSVFAVQMPSVNADPGKTGCPATTMKKHHKHHKTGAACSCRKKHAAKKKACPKSTGAASAVTPKKHKHHCPKGMGSGSTQPQAGQPKPGSSK